jgi:tripartite-type tricarboxylate transporter receptor subunit TctC
MESLKFPIAALASSFCLLIAGASIAQTPSTGSGQAASTGSGQSYPVKPVRVLTPFPTGSGPDSALRLVGERVAKAWGQQLIVDNRPGGNGFIAAEAARRAAADGYTLVQLDVGQLAVHPHLYRKMPYDVVRDFDPVAGILRTYFFMVVPATSQWKSVPDLIAEAKAQPGKLSYGSWFIGSPGHLGAAQLELATGTRMHHVLYKDMTQLYSDVGSREIAWAFGSAGSTSAAYQAKRVRYLAAAAPQRISGYPDVPTVAEAGGPPGFEVMGWVVIMAPRGTPGAAVKRINESVGHALADRDLGERFQVFGYEPMPLPPAQIARLIESDSRRYGEVIRRLNISLD